MVGTKKTERHCKPLNRYSISRWTDGHTIIIPIGIVSLLITERKKILWKGLDFWNTLSITIGTTCIYPKPFGGTITRESVKVVYLLPMIAYWRAIVWTMRYWSPYTTFWKPPMIPPYTNLWTGAWMDFSRLAGTIWNTNSARKPLQRVAKPTTTNFYPAEHYSID